jgi:hypothetical protein
MVSIVLKTVNRSVFVSRTMRDEKELFLFANIK